MTKLKENLITKNPFDQYPNKLTTIVLEDFEMLSFIIIILKFKAKSCTNYLNHSRELISI